MQFLFAQEEDICQEAQPETVANFYMMVKGFKQGLLFLKSKENDFYILVFLLSSNTSVSSMKDIMTENLSELDKGKRKGKESSGILLEANLKHELCQAASSLRRWHGQETTLAQQP